MFVQHVHVFRLQSLDYDVCYNEPFSKMLASRDKKVRMSDKIKLATDSFYWVYLFISSKNEIVITDFIL